MKSMSTSYSLLARYWPLLKPYIELMRLNKPVGIYLLLWPMLWALWIAAQGIPNFSVLIIFVLGAIAMRSAGCVINDVADRNIDGHVSRTQQRPLIRGDITSKQALVLFAGLIGLSFILVLLTNTLTLQLSLIALLLATLYPFMKRHTHLPQVVLGAAFSCSIPMAFAAQSDSLPTYLWLIYLANLSWTVAYDTIYAMVDRDDDIKIGVKSTAILFAEMDTFMIAVLHVISVLCLLMVGQELSLGMFYYLGLVVAALVMVYQHYLIRHRVRDLCFIAFLHSHWAGVAIWIGLVLSYL